MLANTKHTKANGKGTSAPSFPDFSQAIVDTVRTPLLLLDEGLRVLTANRSFYEMFRVSSLETAGRLFRELGNGQWNNVQLEDLLGLVLPGDAPFQGFIVERGFPFLGRRTMLLSGRRLCQKPGQAAAILLSIEDVTERKREEENIAISLLEKEVMLKEIHHRVKNNLQIAANLLQLQETSIAGPATLDVFRQGQSRIRSIALVHEKLYASKDMAKVNMAEYINNLCVELMEAFSPSRTVTLKVDIGKAGDGVLCLDGDAAVAVGLVLNELIINTLKYAFPGGRGEISIEMREAADQNYRLAVRDNGIGMPVAPDFQEKGSLGLCLVRAFVKQLKGTLKVERGEGAGFIITFPVPGKQS